MDSWWELGEGTGHQGTEFQPWRLVCAFCDEKGNFERVFHVEKKKPNADKKLNFEVYKCTNCTGYVHVLWSAGGTWGRGLYDYQVLPWPLSRKREPSENWPKGMHRFWVQAHDSIKNENWDAANVMARSALQFVVRGKGGKGANLKAQIDNLALSGVLHPLMKDWSHEVRLLANDSAHPDVPTPDEVTPQDAKDIVNFLDYLLLYLYDLPQQIEEFRKRKNPSTSASP